MDQQQARAMNTIWMKRGLAWALGATVTLACAGGEPWDAENVEPSLVTASHGLQYGTHEYVIVTTAKPWLEAAAACANMGKGLMTIESSEENDWLLTQQPAGSVWIGANDRVVEGSWVWMDGASTYTRWSPGEPNNEYNEDCAVSDKSSGKWNDVPCAIALPFVCESFDTPQPKQYNGHDYTFFETRKTWPEAKSSCEQMGQNLVSIQDADEELWLKQQAPARSWWLGFNDQAQEGTWVWLDQQPTWYTHWRAGEPNNQYNNEDCAEGNSGPNGSAPAGSWNDLPCSELVSYVCESPASPVAYQYLEYSATNTNSATQGTTDVTVTLQPGQILDVGTCGLPGVFATNDTYLRLLGPGGLEVTNDDECKGLGSRIRFRVPDCGGGTYVIQAGCSEATSCGGRLGYTY